MPRRTVQADPNGNRRNSPTATRRCFDDHFQTLSSQRMASNLTRIPFSESLLPRVQAFDCGSEPWQLEISDWIKAPAGKDGAVDAIGVGTEVWLYANDGGEVV